MSRVCEMVFQLPMALLYGLFFSFGCKDCSDLYLYKVSDLVSQLPLVLNYNLLQDSKFETREKIGAERG